MAKPPMNPRFNVKLLFRGELCITVEVGDFGPAVARGDEQRIDRVTPDDSLLNWPVDPIDETGVPNMLRMLGIKSIERPRVVDLRELTNESA